MQMFKSIMALKIFRRKPAVRRVLWGGELWTGGYYVATVGSGQTGRPSNGTCSGRGSPAKISGSSDCFSSVIPDSLPRELY